VGLEPPIIGFSHKVDIPCLIRGVPSRTYFKMRCV
jgi:hypothetical protein